MIEVKETTAGDIENIRRLWADGDVMHFVGFPNGLHQTDEEMQRWFRWIDSNRPAMNHYSIFEDGIYCGETFYEIDKEHNDHAALDIKLFRFARGRGIAADSGRHPAAAAVAYGWYEPGRDCRCYRKVQRQCEKLYIGSPEADCKSIK